MVGPVSIVGAGRTGRTLGLLIHRAGIPLSRITSRSAERAREAVQFIGAGTPEVDLHYAGEGAEIVLVCVPDDAIPEVASRLLISKGAVVAHTAGLLGSGALGALGKVETGSLHPLKSFSDPARAAESFAGTLCALEGTRAAVAALRSLVTAIGGIPVEVPSAGKPLYHAGAVFASNYLVAIFDAASRLFEKAGIGGDDAKAALLKLAEGTLANLRAQGSPAALTGPIERGDAKTVEAQAEAIRNQLPELFEAFAALARLTAGVAVAKGSLTREGAGKINAILGSGSTGIVVERAK